MKIYDKLVRDRIPEIIEYSGNHCEVEIVNDEVALEYLYKKLNEEIEKLLEDKHIEEIVDLVEVLFAIGKKYGYSEEDILNKRCEKRKKSSGFDYNFVLKKTW